MEEIVTKVAPPATGVHPQGGSLRESQDRELRLRVSAESLANMRKRAIVTVEAPAGSAFAITCDEGAYLGGDDSAPPPLAYFSAAIAF